MSTRSKIEEALLQEGNLLSDTGFPAVSSLSYDSRTTEPGAAFFCLPGERTDGNLFTRDAIARGATLVVSEKQDTEIGVPQIVVPDVRRALALAAEAHFNSPTKNMRVIGVTGTNGKTTTTHLVELTLNRSGKKCGLIGTLGARWPGHPMDESKHTTPQAPELQQLFARMRDDGCTHAAMEVSSHSLALKRVDGCRFALSCLTNVTQDHLDFHKTMEHYWRSKLRLFEMLSESDAPARHAVVNADDDLAAGFIEGCRNGVEVVTYGFAENASFRIMELAYRQGFSEISVKTPQGLIKLKTKLLGTFNAYNAAAAAAISFCEGATLESIEETLSGFAGVPGRFEVVPHASEGPLCIVDYAHTPDGLENVLKTAAGLKKNGAKLFVVFGCGGDRDPSKRPQMGEIAERCADEVIVTSDNPRTEDPESIIAAILTGIKRLKHLQVEPDRARAIDLAVAAAGPEDIVVIAGKGHENYQLIGNKVLPFDDKVETGRALSRRVSSQN